MRDRVIDQALYIPGQTWKTELTWLYSLLAPSKEHVEVGVYCGRSLYVTAGALRKAKLHAVDLAEPGWRPNHPTPTWSKQVLDITLGAIKQNFPSVEVVTHFDGSMAAATRLANTKVDSVFIDANHDYDQVINDIDSWLPLIKPGGVICGHDYYPACHGVMDAVNERLESFHVQPNTRMWWHRVKG